MVAMNHEDDDEKKPEKGLIFTAHPLSAIILYMVSECDSPQHPECPVIQKCHIANIYDNLVA